jgi:hypothetical protein
MPSVRNDIPLSDIRDAARKVSLDARSKAFNAGTTITYVVDGTLVRESAKGVITVIGPSLAGNVLVRKKVWKLKPT